MTTTKHESIMVALETVLAGADPAVKRNTPLPDLSAGAGKVIVLSDAQPVETEAFLNPPMYEFTVTPRVLVCGSSASESTSLPS